MHLPGIIDKTLVERTPRVRDKGDRYRKDKEDTQDSDKFDRDEEEKRRFSDRKPSPMETSDSKKDSGFDPTKANVNGTSIDEFETSEERLQLRKKSDATRRDSSDTSQKRKGSVQGGYRQPNPPTNAQQQPSDNDGIESRATNSASILKDSGYSDGSRYQTPDDNVGTASSTDYESSTMGDPKRQMQRPMLGRRDQYDSSTEGPSSSQQDGVGILRTIVDEHDEDQQRIFNDNRGIPMDTQGMLDGDQQRLFSDTNGIPLDTLHMPDENIQRIFNDAKGIPLDALHVTDPDIQRIFNDVKGFPLDAQDMPPEDTYRLFNDSKGIPLDIHEEEKPLTEPEWTSAPRMKYSNMYRNGGNEDLRQNGSIRPDHRQKPNLISPDFMEGQDR